MTRNSSGQSDPAGQVWAVPYRWGCTLVAYRPDKLGSRQAELALVHLAVTRCWGHTLAGLCQPGLGARMPSKWHQILFGVVPGQWQCHHSWHMSPHGFTTAICNALDMSSWVFVAQAHVK